MSEKQVNVGKKPKKILKSKSGKKSKLIQDVMGYL